MISGHLLLGPGNKAHEITPAHSRFVEAGSIETETLQAWLVVETDGLQPSVAAQWWGQKMQDHQYAALRKDTLERPLQALVIERDKKDGHIEVERNCHATCPLYLVVGNGVLHMHWDPTELYKHISGDVVNREAAVAFLEMTWSYGAETPFRQIMLLPERGRALFMGSTLEIIRPPSIEEYETAPLKEGADVLSHFYEMLQLSASRWLSADADGVFCALSSGLDTTIVCHAVKEQLPQGPLRTFGYLPIDEKGRDVIRARRRETVDMLGLDDYLLPIENCFDQAFLPHAKYWPYQNPSSFQDAHMGRRIATAGGNIIFTGVGGDELCLLSEAERARLPRPAATPVKKPPPPPPLSFIPDAAKKHADAPQRWPNGPVSESSPEMANSKTFLYLRHGIWMAHPLALADVQTFARFLPVEWRQNRRLSRDILSKLGHSESFVAQVPKETLGPTMDALMLRIDWENRFDNAVLLDYGLVDLARLKEAARTFRETRNQRLGVKLLAALALELSLCSAHG